MTTVTSPRTKRRDIMAPPSDTHSRPAPCPIHCGVRRLTTNCYELDSDVAERTPRPVRHAPYGNQAGGRAMRIGRLIISATVLVLACVRLVTSQTTAAGGGGQRGGGGGQRGGGGGRADAPMVGEGTLVAGAWGKDPVPLDSRGWGWMTKSYVSLNYKRPFYNKAKEM